jgi:hypothetical protein
MSFRLPRLSGKITYNTIETDEPLSKSSVEGCEDLLQVEYANGLILDVGWYEIKGTRTVGSTTNRDLHGAFFVKGVRDKEWGDLVLELAARDYDELRVAIALADFYLESLRD